MTGDFNDANREVGEEWNRAEEAIKLAEQINREVVSPAIFELRYAGRKLIEANQIQETDAKQAFALLQDAKMDCLRARHDAIDAATSKIISDLDIAIVTLGPTKVLSCYPEWGDTYKQICEVREKISVSRKDRNNRDAIYLTVEAIDLPKAVNLYNKFKGLEPRLIAETKKDRRQIVYGYLVGVVGVLIGAISLVFC